YYCMLMHARYILDLLTVVLFSVFFFNDPATTEIYPLSLHDALPILGERSSPASWEGDAAELLPGTFGAPVDGAGRGVTLASLDRDRKSTRLNSSHVKISYAVFCLKKKKNQSM